MGTREEPAATPAEAEETDMKWRAPKIVEIAVGMEINCYACAGK
jgi:coenzyme PQQ precursor peptide PqqA